ncbi:LuxR C-terminal-related transcriptional regulator [Myxococcus sp. K15C18031901]|uniref:helix-turn-helix transcriptional regulator n=1 Tax=Myxococcus dinghuensis TaxID=2906761 RepID=UPI0020A775C4|nr:LuxR C-terminal-related transcriptional regulator [Myxococcus dinghuensis]MCP3100044.1 LuxR C-terminal-related transcriptional regulator [Myxococcus dinghuensis]
MKGAHLRSSHVRELVRLINETHELPAGPGARPRHLLSGICRILGSDAAVCVREEDFRPEGTGAFTATVLAGWGTDRLSAVQSLQRMGSACNPAIRALMRRRPAPGSVVTAMRRDLVGDRAWYSAPYVEHHLLPTGLDDSVYSGRWSERPGVVQGIGIHRGRSGRRFDAAERELLNLFHSECWALLGPVEQDGDRPQADRLSPRERQTLTLLLQGLGDKDIAARMEISRFTVNQYTKSLYKHFGVRSRAALLALFLERMHKGPA